MEPHMEQGSTVPQIQIDLSKYKKPQENKTPKLTPEELLSQQRHENDVISQQEMLSNQSFNYLSLYEQKRKVMMAESEKAKGEMLKRQAEVDEKRPAFFQKNARHQNNDWREEEFENWKKLQEATKMDFNPDEKSYEEMRDFFKVPTDKNVLEDMNTRMFESMQTRLKER
jgi:hypothetical protein